ncbi:GNAT family N-acetyltransferase [Mesorhizobium sp. B1-1-5]|uniref:GNAT family N-acetyltransferase n=1 Tax=Mesorhizobium sp. B1-1-5 TaxID=2589979 RepID=UPI001127FCCB|nr:GNAT family N-acetyltransferase [Mesorhizobium sp. B1-1-5]TPN72270.1 GNAT family N-acetyltransferase [Mesorhizobium sp. B1-1-5]
MPSLDVDAVRTFVMVADLQSFTRAAAALGSTQATISVKLRRLEEKLGARLIERTPRRVALSARGAAFLPAAREFLAAHERAVTEFSDAPCRLALGFVDHVAGPELSIFIAQLHAHDPSLALNIRIDTSSMLEEAFDRGELDAVIVHQEDDSRRGEALSRTQYGWFADPEVRGKGIGAALIEAVKQEAGKIGVRNVYWMTHETNATARKLYDHVARRTGFIEYDLL